MLSLHTKSWDHKHLTGWVIFFFFFTQIYQSWVQMSQDHLEKTPEGRHWHDSMWNLGGNESLQNILRSWEVYHIYQKVLLVCDMHSN